MSATVAGILGRHPISIQLFVYRRLWQIILQRSNIRLSRNGASALLWSKVEWLRIASVALRPAYSAF